MREFCSAANDATETGVKMTTDVFLKYSTTTPGRLVGLEFGIRTHDELIRLCLLAYLKSFLSQFKVVELKTTFLSERLKTVLLAQSSKPSRLQLWMLFISALCIFSKADNEWLREMLVRTASSLGLRTWRETRVVLKSLLWIDMVLDTPGKDLFNKWLAAE